MEIRRCLSLRFTGLPFWSVHLMFQALVWQSLLGDWLSTKGEKRVIQEPDNNSNQDKPAILWDTDIQTPLRTFIKTWFLKIWAAFKMFTWLTSDIHTKPRGWRGKKTLKNLVFFSPLHIPVLGVFYNHIEGVSIPSCNAFRKISPHLPILIESIWIKEFQIISLWHLKAYLLRFSHLWFAYLFDYHQMINVHQSNPQSFFFFKK